MTDIVNYAYRDPLIRPFWRGPTFLFDGLEGKYYDLFSDPSDLYSVTFRAKLGKLSQVP